MMSDAGSNPAAVSSRPEPGPGLVLDVQLVCKRWGAVEVVRDVSLALREGERHALVGPNGAGKSTLLNVVAGRLSPGQGEIERGATVKIDRKSVV
jgi:branched-chain amino acid transport system ATP-binding protein